MKSRFNERINAAFDLLKTTGFFSIAGSNVVNRALSFLSGILVVRALSKADYGIYSYAYNILNIALLFNGMGVASAFIQLCSERGGNEKELTLERFGLLMGGLFDVFLSFGIFLWASLTPEEMAGTRPLLQLCALFPLPQFLFDMQTSALRSQLRNNDFALANMINTAFVVVGTISGAMSFGAMGLLIGRFFGTFVSVVIITVTLRVPLLFSCSRNSNVESIELSRTDRVDYIKISISSALTNGISSFTYLMGTFMIGKLLADPLEVASYEAASAIPVALNFVPATIMTYVYPYFARHNDDYEWVRKRYVQLMILMLVGFGAISLICFTFSSQIITLVYGKQYLSSVTAFRILIFGAWFGSAFRIVSGNLLVTQRLVIANVIINAINVAAILSLNLLLVPQFGAIGSAFAQTVGLCFSGVLNTLTFSYKIWKSEPGAKL